MYLNKCGGEVVSQLSESLAELRAVNGAGAISVESLEQVPPLLDEIEQRDELVHLEYTIIGISILEWRLTSMVPL